MLEFKNSCYGNSEEKIESLQIPRNFLCIISMHLCLAILLYGMSPRKSVSPIKYLKKCIVKVTENFFKCQ